MEKDEIKNALLNTTIGKFLSNQEIDTLIQYSTVITFAPGEFILQQGKSNNGMYILLDGTALVTAKILGEGGTYIATLTHGNLAGEISLIEKSPTATSVIASTQVKCLFITNSYFILLDLIFSDTKYKIIRGITDEICNRICDLHNKIANFMTQSDMITQSMFSEVIKSLTKLTPIDLKDVGSDLQVLHKDKLFEKFDQEEFTIFLNNTTPYKASKNCPLISEKETQPLGYIIIRGAVQSSIVEDNKIAKLSVLGPTHLIANISIINKSYPSIINYTTCERSIVLRMNETNLNYLQQNHQKLWYKFFNLVCKSFIGLEYAADKLDIRLNSELYNR